MLIVVSARPDNATSIATTISAQIRPYSIAVAPALERFSLRRKSMITPVPGGCKLVADCHVHG